ncbi:MAG: stage V sporulation protein S [Eubacteriales bacterium]
MEVLKVSAKSSPNLVAGAIAGVIRDCGAVEVQAIGAGAVNQAIKAIAVAGAFLTDDQIEISCKPSFAEVSVNDEQRTAIKLIVKADKPAE